MSLEIPRVTARSMLFDLYGDFATEQGRGGTLRLGAIVRFARDLGVTEMAARAAAARMVQDGWLASGRLGRESQYALTPRGARLVQAGGVRMFQTPDDAWDGTWYVVALSVPEAQRDVRDRMRKELSWLGFGSPSSALYLSARDQRETVERLAQDLDAEKYLQVYRATAWRPEDPRELVARAWNDLETINQRYADFLNRFAPEQERTRTAMQAGSFQEREAFRLRFTLANQFRRCLYNDPALPTALLPAAWWGSAARVLFQQYHALVTPAALHYFDSVAARDALPG